jgi:putative heme iron utilization protein
MSETINKTISQRICQHMNEDHSEAVALYGTFLANLTDVKSAKMVSIDNQGMDLLVITTTGEITTRIEFDHQLTDATDAHHTLIDLLKQARSKANHPTTRGE